MDKDFDRLSILTEWLKILMDGRAKPDRHNNQPFIRESVEYIGLINRINKELETELELKTFEEF